MMRVVALSSLLVLSASSQSIWAQSTPRFQNMREAIEALKTATSPSEAERVRAAMANTPVRDHDDLMAVYDEARRREDKTPLFANATEFDEYVRNGQAVASHLNTSDPTLQDDIAALIDKERESWSNVSVPMIPVGKLSLRDGAKSAQRVIRVEALFDAAGKGKNEKARPALWRVVDSVHDAYFGQLAVAALGKIRNPQDLERLIQMIETSPNLHFQFNDFGAMAIQPLVNEIRNHNLQKETQARLAGGLRQVASRDTLSTYVPLMHDGNQFISEQARWAVGDYLRSTDEDLIQTMLKDPSFEVKAVAMGAIDGRAWDPKFIPLLIAEVQNGNDAAARCLGHHKVKSAVPALEKALNSPKNYMKRAAGFALKEINGK